MPSTLPAPRAEDPEVELTFVDAPAALTPDEARLIDATHARLGGTLYEVLGVRADAGEAVIKAAYLDLSQRFHPDRFVRRANPHRLFQVEAIYRAVRAALLTLGDARHRAAYDATLRRFQTDAPWALPGDHKTSGIKLRDEVAPPPPTDARGERTVVPRVVRGVVETEPDLPLDDAPPRARPAPAANDSPATARRVVTDGAPAPRKATGPAPERTPPDRHAALARQHERAGRWERAVAAWRQGCDEHPGDLALHAGLVNAACEGLVELSTAASYARRATRFAPKNARAAALLARVELLEGNAASARRALADALALDPVDAVALDLARRLRVR